MGQFGEKEFMLRIGIGFAGDKVKMADRELKDRWGIMAYSIAGLKALRSVPQATYKLTVDGEEFELDGKNCLIDNAGSLGLGSLSAAKDISVSDGLLEVMVFRDSSVSSWIGVGKEVMGRDPNPEAVRHSQCR
jgi:diacylglycerol kinase family enzyme